MTASVLVNQQIHGRGQFSLGPSALTRRESLVGFARDLADPATTTA